MFKKMLVFTFLFLSFIVLAACGQQENLDVGLESLAFPPAAFSSTLVVQHSGHCADVFKNSLERDADLIQYDCHGKANQRFTFHPVAGKADTYLLKSESSGLCADVSLSQKVSGDYVVHQWSCHANANQQFTLKATGSSKVFSLVAGHDGRCVSVVGGSPYNRANLVAHTCNGAKSQQWKLAGYVAASAPRTCTDERDGRRGRRHRLRPHRRLRLQRRQRNGGPLPYESDGRGGPIAAARRRAGTRRPAVQTRANTKNF